MFMCVFNESWTLFCTLDLTLEQTVALLLTDLIARQTRCVSNFLLAFSDSRGKYGRGNSRNATPLGACAWARRKEQKE